MFAILALLGARAEAEPVSFVEALRRVRPSVVCILCTKGADQRVGAGVVVDREGNVLTVAHLINGCIPRAQLASKRLLSLRLVGVDAALDLAVLRLEGDKALALPPPATFAPSLEVGEPVAALGQPAGLPMVASAGIVGALDVEAPSSAGVASGQRWRLVATDATTAPGSSGGPLVRTDGTIAGLVVMTHTEARLTLAHGVPALLQGMARIAAANAAPVPARATSAPRRSRP